MGAILPKRHRAWHDQIIDLLMIRPGITQNEIAAALDKTPAWVSTVMRTDMFKAKYAIRRSDHNARISQAAVENLSAIDEASQDVIMKALQDPACDPRFALDAKDKALRGLGFGRAGGALQGGAVSTPGSTPAEIAGAVTKEVLDHARATMARIQEQHTTSGEVFDGEAEVVSG